MRKRTKARECALHMLYQVEMTRDTADTTIENYWKYPHGDALEDDLKAFADDIVKGVQTNRKEIDAMVARYAANWHLDRMAVVDRNILRLGSYELKFRSDIPPKVAINEAVELAKKYSGQEAGKFVNAILDKIRIEVGK